MYTSTQPTPPLEVLRVKGYTVQHRVHILNRCARHLQLRDTSVANKTQTLAFVGSISFLDNVSTGAHGACVLATSAVRPLRRVPHVFQIGDQMATRAVSVEWVQHNCHGGHVRARVKPFLGVKARSNHIECQS